MAAIALQQVSSEFAKHNAGRTLDKPVALRFLEPSLKPEDFEILKSESENGGIYVWGATLERFHQLDKILPKRCLVLFRKGHRIYKCGVITHSIIDLNLAEKLWGTDSDGETWGWIWFFKRTHDISFTSAELNKIIGWKENNHWQGLVGLKGEAADTVIELVKQQLGL